jgi:hypothetical protein
MKVLTGTKYLLGDAQDRSTLALRFDSIEEAQAEVVATRKHQESLGYKPEEFVIFVETFISVWDDDSTLRSRTITRQRV